MQRPNPHECEADEGETEDDDSNIGVCAKPPKQQRRRSDQDTELAMTPVALRITEKSSGQPYSHRCGQGA